MSPKDLHTTGAGEGVKVSVAISPPAEVVPKLPDNMLSSAEHSYKVSVEHYSQASTCIGLTQHADTCWALPTSQLNGISHAHRAVLTVTLSPLTRAW